MYILKYEEFQNNILYTYDIIILLAKILNVFNKFILIQLVF